MTTGSSKAAALSGLRVVDLSERPGGAYCAKLLAEYGADVVLVEPSGGNLLRRRGPRAAANDTSATFAWYHGGKRGVVGNVDLDRDETDDPDRRRLRTLVEEADVLVETCSPSERDSLGLTLDRLHEWNPSLVLVSVTDFGQTGPYRDFRGGEGVVEALSGQMFATGPADRPPLAAGVEICEATAGLHAYIGTLCALRLRKRDGRGRQVDASLLEAGLENMELRAYPAWRAGLDPSRSDLERPAVVPWGVYPCRDGLATLHGAPFRRWRSFARLLRGGRGYEAIYAAGIARAERSSETGSGSVGGGSAGKLKRFFFRVLHREVGRWAAQRTKEEILAAAIANDLAFGVVRSLAEIPDLAQHRARGFFTRIDHPGIGCVSQPRWLFPCESAGCGPSPRLGEHQHQAWAQPRGTRPRGTGLSDTADGPSPLSPDTAPLAGVRVLDLTLVEAAPHGTRLLADYGAEVIKIEYPRRLDVFRGSSLQDRAYDRQALWQQLHRNKRSVTLDLKTEQGRSAFFDLLGTTDVVVSNFRCGVLESLGLDHSSLRERKPDIITLGMSAFGCGGPDSRRPAYGAVIEAMSGVQDLSGHPGGPPERIREIDVLNGIAGAAAVLTALHRRSATGEGGHIDLSQMEATTHALMGDVLLAQSAGLPVPARGSSRSGGYPEGCFPCAGRLGRWIYLSVSDPAHWQALARLVGRPEWGEDPSPANGEAREIRDAEIAEAIASWTRHHSPDEAMMRLQAAGVPAGAVHSFAEVTTDPHVLARDWFSEHDGVRFMGYPFRISGYTPPPPRKGPDLGEANAAYREEVESPGNGAAFHLDLENLGSAFRLDPVPGTPSSRCREKHLPPIP